MISKQATLAMLPVKGLKVKDYKGNIQDVFVDGDYDGEWFETISWRILPNGYVYTRERIKMPDGRYMQKITYLHHLVLPPRSGFWTKFIDGNKLNVRSCNLTYHTPSESAVTRKQRVFANDSISASKYRGVSRVRWGDNVSPNSWVAIAAGKHLGTFDSEIAAAKAYDKAAVERWGDKAILNFPEEIQYER